MTNCQILASMGADKEVFFWNSQPSGKWGLPPGCTLQGFHPSRLTARHVDYITLQQSARKEWMSGEKCKIWAWSRTPVNKATASPLLFPFFHHFSIIDLPRHVSRHVVGHFLGLHVTRGGAAFAIIHLLPQSLPRGRFSLLVCLSGGDLLRCEKDPPHSVSELGLRDLPKYTIQ